MFNCFAMADAPKPLAFISRTFAGSMLGRRPVYTPARSRSIRPWRRCSIPAAVALRKDISGPSLVTIGRGAGWIPPAVAYSYAPGRGAVHALKLLESYRGIVQCDGYAAYKSIADEARTGEAITLAFFGFI